MGNVLDRWIEPLREDARRELRAELAEFSFDGLTRLRADLRVGRVLRGSWDGCPLSYRRGAAGSSRRDRLGRRQNVLTHLWDRGDLTDEEVARIVGREIRRRNRCARAPV